MEKELSRVNHERVNGQPFAYHWSKNFCCWWWIDPRPSRFKWWKNDRSIVRIEYCIALLFRSRFLVEQTRRKIFHSWRSVQRRVGINFRHVQLHRFRGRFRCDLRGNVVHLVSVVLCPRVYGRFFGGIWWIYVKIWLICEYVNMNRGKEKIYSI